MKIRLSKLRQLIREQLGTMVFVHNAGFGGGGGISNMKQHKDAPAPGLGDEEEQEKEEDGKEQEKSQWTVRARDKQPR
jgi:hypothetical protein